MAFLAPILGTAVGGAISGAGGGGNEAPQLASSTDTAKAYYDTQNEMKRQQALVQAMMGASPDIYAQQQQLANQLGQQAMGMGPNPALSQLNQTTGQNIAAQNALMASQRGASANPALLARQAAMQGGALNQQAAGQAATLKAQQQLASQQALAQQQAQITGQQMNTVQNLGNFTLGNQGMLNNAALGVAQTNAPLNAQIQKQQAGALAGAGSGLGSALTSGLFYDGGMVPAYSQGGPVSRLGRSLVNMQDGGKVPGRAAVKGDSPKNDTVPAMLSPGEIVIPKSIIESKDAPRKAFEFVKAVLGRRG